MSREILTRADIQKFNDSGEASRFPVGSSIPTGKDNYIDRLFKYIPSELVAGYIFVLGAMLRLTQPGEIKIFQWSIFIIFCVLTPLYLWRIQKVKKIQQLVISLLSFAVWVFALGGPFALYKWYNPVYGEILLPLFTFSIAIWEADS